MYKLKMNLCRNKHWSPFHLELVVKVCYTNMDCYLVVDIYYLLSYIANHTCDHKQDIIKEMTCMVAKILKGAIQILNRIKYVFNNSSKIRLAYYFKTWFFKFNFGNTYVQAAIFGNCFMLCPYFYIAVSIGKT